VTKTTHNKKDNKGYKKFCGNSSKPYIRNSNKPYISGLFGWPMAVKNANVGYELLKT
jgi:hypothetical protein